MESKEIEDKEFDSKDNEKCYDNQGNILWCSKFGARCLNCCKFFNDDDEVTEYKCCDHYICNDCDMEKDDSNYYVGYYLQYGGTCFKCISAIKKGYLPDEDDDDRIDKWLEN